MGCNVTSHWRHSSLDSDVKNNQGRGYKFSVFKREDTFPPKMVELEGREFEFQVTSTIGPRQSKRL